MAHVVGHEEMKSFARWNRHGKFEHWKYPETVGNDTTMDDINFNSHESSDYAKLRMTSISPMTQEPFVLLEFLTIDQSKQPVAGQTTEAWKKASAESLDNAGNAFGKTWAIYNNFWKVVMKIQ